MLCRSKFLVMLLLATMIVNTQVFARSQLRLGSLLFESIIVGVISGYMAGMVTVQYTAKKENFQGDVFVNPGDAVGLSLRRYKGESTHLPVGRYPVELKGIHRDGGQPYAVVGYPAQDDDVIIFTEGGV